MCEHSVAPEKHLSPCVCVCVCTFVQASAFYKLCVRPSVRLSVETYNDLPDDKFASEKDVCVFATARSHSLYGQARYIY